MNPKENPCPYCGEAPGQPCFKRGKYSGTRAAFMRGVYHQARRTK